MRKVRLGKVLLDAKLLMVNIMIVGIIGEEQLEWIERELETTMIVNRFRSRHGKEDEILTCAEARTERCNNCS